MRTIVSILFIAFAFCAKGQDSTSAYRRHLEQRAWTCGHKLVLHVIPVRKAFTGNERYFIPRYEIPKGSVFCRMEDKLNRATKVWIKIGTNNNK